MGFYKCFETSVDDGNFKRPYFSHKKCVTCVNPMRAETWANSNVVKLRIFSGAAYQRAKEHLGICGSDRSS